MSRPRKDQFSGWMPGLYRKKLAKRMLYYTLKPSYINLGYDLSAARRKLLEIQEVGSSLATVAGLLDEFMRHRSELSSRTGRPAALTIKGNVIEAQVLKEVFGHMLLGDVTTQHVWHYLHQTRGRNAPVRSNREISLLSAAFRYGLNRGLCQSNPCLGVEKNLERPRSRAIALEELNSFCEFAALNRHQSAHQQKRQYATGPVIASASRLAFLTAKSESQILNLEIKDIRDDGIYFGKRKHGHATVVEWTPSLRDCVNSLLAMRADRHGTHLVQSQTGAPYTLSGFIAVWRRVMSAWVKSSERGTREKFTFHDLRAMAITRLKTEGRDPKLLSGHTSDKIPDLVYDQRRERRAKAVM